MQDEYLTVEQVQNLRALQEYLTRAELQARFDMSKYCQPGWEFGDRVTCGSVGCAVGHGPFAGVPIGRHELWYDYAERAFGADSDIASGSDSNLLWRWLFSSWWEASWPHAEHASKRIAYRLKFKSTRSMLRGRRKLDPDLAGMLKEFKNWELV